jgi:hypothetical protein
MVAYAQIKRGSGKTPEPLCFIFTVESVGRASFYREARQGRGENS